MSAELSAAAVKAINAKVEELIKSKTITAENYDNSSVVSKLLTVFMKSEEVMKPFPRPKVQAVWKDTIASHFTSEEKQPEEEEEENDGNNDDDENVEDQDEEETQPEEEEEKKEKPKKRQAPKKEKKEKKQKDDFSSKVEKEEKPKRASKTNTIRATRKTNPKSHREYALCNSYDIANDKSIYNVTGISYPKKSKLPTSDVDLPQAELELIKYFTNDQKLCDEYSTIRSQYKDAVTELRKKHEIDEKKAKRPQKFTVTKSTVKYVDLVDDKYKLVELPKTEQECFRTYEKEMKEFTEKFKKAIKPEKSSFPAKGTKKTKTQEEKETEKQQKQEAKQASLEHDLSFLLLDVIRTQNIIKLDSLLKCDGIHEEDSSKLTNTLIDELDDNDWATIQSNEKYKPFAPDYIQLFIDIKKFNGSNYGRLCKTIYNHREALIHHPKLTEDNKITAWVHALTNIQAIKSKLKIDDDLVLNCWENVLSSEFAFKIIMLGLEPSDYFKHSFELLIQTPTSVQLFESALYPISFLFTPNMLGRKDYAAPDSCFGKTDPTYKKNLRIELESFGNPEYDLFNYNAFNWLYYFNKQDIRNDMVSLLRRAVQLANHEEAKDEEETKEE